MTNEEYCLCLVCMIDVCLFRINILTIFIFLFDEFFDNMISNSANPLLYNCCCCYKFTTLVVEELYWQMMDFATFVELEFDEKIRVNI